MSLTQTALTAKTGDATPLLIPVMYGHGGGYLVTDSGAFISTGL